MVFKILNECNQYSVIIVGIVKASFFLVAAAYAHTFWRKAVFMHPLQRKIYTKGFVD